MRSAKPDSPVSRAPRARRNPIWETAEGISSSTDTTKSRWWYRVAFTANVYLDIETGSAETPDEELERLAIEAFRAGSKEDRDLPLDDAEIDLPALPGGRLYPEPNLDGGLEGFSIEG